MKTSTVGLSLPRQTVNRILKQFEADSLITLRQGAIALKNVEGMRGMMDI